jgi:hypothetical protein
VRARLLHRPVPLDRSVRVQWTHATRADRTERDDDDVGLGVVA